MAYRNLFDRQLEPDLSPAPVHAQTMDDVERRRRALEAMGLDKGVLGKANQIQGDLSGQRDAMRQDVRDRLLGSGPTPKLASASGGGGVGGMANDAAKGAAKDGAMSALGASL